MGSGTQPHCAEILDSGVPDEARGGGIGPVGEQQGYAQRLGPSDLRDLLVELGALVRIGIAPRLPDEAHDQRYGGRVIASVERPEDLVGIEAERGGVEREGRLRVTERRRVERAQTSDNADLAEGRRDRL